MGVASVQGTVADAVSGVILAGILDEVSEEILRAGRKHGPESMAAPGHDAGKRLGILMEEGGEVAEEVSLLLLRKSNEVQAQLGRIARRTTYDNGDFDSLREELVQLTAMGAAWLHALEAEGRFQAPQFD